METGRDFLREQVSQAVVQHQVLLDALDTQSERAHDSRLRDLCARHLPHMREHQRALESYRDTLGEAGAVKEALGSFLGKAREALGSLAGNDFERVTGDLAAIQQTQDAFALFAAVGDTLGESRLADIGRAGARDHQAMQRDFFALAQTMFTEHARGEARREAVD
jgi:ferritin-like metal-binding protein YciE